jgi:PhzF family phenazine biosynthesis protein
MKLPVYWVDAFAERAFQGNPAAVVPLHTWQEDALLQKIAFEHGLSETAFFVKLGKNRYHLRWFSPTVEVDLCGHATLGAAHVLFHELNLPGDEVTFDSKSGALTVARRSDGKLELNFPARPAASLSYDVSAVTSSRESALVRGLGLAPDFVAKTDRMWICVYPQPEDVIALRPNHALLAGVVPGRISVTAPGRDCDFVSRYFAPDAGIPEDPVTGAAHCTLVPYWAARLDRNELHARQLSRRGGELWCTLAGDRVKLAGHSTLYLRGEITL